MKDEYPSQEPELSPARIDAHFNLLRSRLENVPELQSALELATVQPELVEDIYNGYAALITGMTGLTDTERYSIRAAKAHMLQTDSNFGTASEVSADELLAELGERKDVLTELVSSSIDPASPYTAPALDELVKRMEGGHRLKLSGKQPSDGDEESRKVIWGHTMITDSEALIHFISCHYLERYFAVGLTAQGSQLAQQKDFMLNALIDAVLVDHNGANKFAVIYDKWQTPKESGGLGWITDDRLASYKNAQPNEA